MFEGQRLGGCLLQRVSKRRTLMFVSGVGTPSSHRCCRRGTYKVHEDRDSKIGSLRSLREKGLNPLFCGVDGIKASSFDCRPWLVILGQGGSES